MLSSRALRALAVGATFAMGCNLLLDIGDGSVARLDSVEDASPKPSPFPQSETGADAQLSDAITVSPDVNADDVDAGPPFVPVNVEPSTYDLNATVSLRGSFELNVTRDNTQITPRPSGPNPAVRWSVRCGCLVISLDTLELAKGESVMIHQSVPVVIVARRVVLAGTVVLENTTSPVQYYPPPPTDAGADVDSGGPPMNGLRAVDGRSARGPALIGMGFDYSGGGGGGGAQAGASGGTYTVRIPPIAGAQGGTLGDQQVLALGGNGGWGGDECPPGAGGGALQITAREYLELSQSGLVRANGHGAYACPDESGGGGGAGGMIVLEGRSLALFGTVAAVGGGGAGGARRADPPAPGSPGQTSSGTERAQSGASSGGQGGVSLSVGPVNGESLSNSNYPSGGGGAAGFILYRHGGTIAVDGGPFGEQFAPSPLPSQLR